MKFEVSKIKDASLVGIKWEIEEGKCEERIADDRTLYHKDCLRVPNVDGLREKILVEIHDTPYSVVFGLDP